MTSTTAVELVWTAVALAGILVQAWLLRDALESRHAARRLRAQGHHVNGPRLRLIRSHVRESLGYLGVHVAFVWAGARALWDHASPPLGPGRLVTILLLMGASVALVVLGLQARSDRLWVRSYKPEKEEELW